VTERTLVLVKPDAVQRQLAGRIIARFEERGLKIVGLEGPNAIGMVRAMVGGTKPAEAAPGTIRGDLAIEMIPNLIHASDGPETAATELAIWFQPHDLVSYRREIDRWVMGPEAR
jgi:nucleoside-diphosphate kinase